MNFKKLSTLGLLMALFFNAKAQHDHAPCGTQDGKVPWLVEYQKAPMAFPRSAEVLLIPIKIHVVGKSNGTGFFNTKNILDAFCQLNEDFLQADIQFFIDGELNYITKDTWYEHSFQQGSQMMNQNNFSNTINCYIVGDPAGNCGYSDYTRGIALKKSCLGPSDHTWAHEVGHYLSLPHPFYGWEGFDHDYSLPAPNDIDGYQVERADGTNCHFAADGFCDTPADYLNDRWTCTPDGLSQTLQHDPNGVAFQSDGTLFMSYSNDNCSDHFSEEQIEAMRANLMTDRDNLLDQATPIDAPDAAAFTAISPLQDELVDDYKNVFFEWAPVPGATHYLLEVTLSQTFSFVLFRYEVTGTSFMCNDLSANKNYRWRLLPYNGQHTCEVYTEVKSFFTGDFLNAVENLDAVSGLTISPNPAQAGAFAHISLSADRPMLLDGTLLTATGQLTRQFSWQVAAGQNQTKLETNGLAPGVYFLRLRSDEGMVSRKVVVQ